MIDPTDITRFDRTDAELEEFWLFSCVVAGKTATIQVKLLDNFLNALPGDSPFDKVARADAQGALRTALEASRLGQYRRLTRCFSESLTLDLRRDPVEAFESVYGIGAKTARMFLMHSRPDQRFAAIDTHVLKHLRAQGFKAPKATPSAGPLYRELEQAFLELADRAGQTPADYDLMVWREYARTS